MRVSVLVPTYRRTNDLLRCLHGLFAQRRQADELLVIVRESDTQTLELLSTMRDRSFLRIVKAQQGGQVASLNAGLDQAGGDIVMITDDDAIPRAGWVERVEAHFIGDDRLGGVGGRDVVHEGERILSGRMGAVGIVEWTGRLVGNHHLGARQPVYVDILKGANMAYRRAAIGELRFDTALRGAGAQVGNDMAFSLAVGARGWRLLYDPEVIVDHYPAARLDNDRRGAPDLQAIENMAFNTWRALSHHMPRGSKRSRAMLWERAIGTRGCPGELRGLLATLTRNDRGRELYAAARRGREDASKS